MFASLALALVLGAEPKIDEKAEAELSVEIRREELKAHVDRLSSAEFLGRRGPGAARAARHIAEAFARLNLKPAFDGSYLQRIPWRADKDGGSFVGQNVAAVLPGDDPTLAAEWIVLSAHLDHLGVQGSTVYPGADDNASGCAMLLEVAERFALRGTKPRRTIVFVAFDQEESGLLGSTHFAAHPPMEFRKLRAFLTADMIGRSMADVMHEYVFALGSEQSPELRRLLEQVAPPDGLKVGRVGADFIGTRSDYGPFRDRRIPFLFFSTGTHADYHTPQDTPDRIDADKLHKISQWIYDLTARLTDTDIAPTWAKEGLPPDLDEVRTIALLLSRVLENPVLFALSESQATLVKSTVEKLRRILDRGTYTKAERTTLLWTARLLMATLF